MSGFQRIEMSRQYVAISRELKMTLHPARHGPEPRTDGLTVGIVEMSRDAHTAARCTRMVMNSSAS